MDKNKKSKKMLEGHSQVNKYELLALEQRTAGGPTEERTSLAFLALDELIPKLGVYSPVVKKLRNDFFDAVYSDQLTAIQASKTGGANGFIQNLPYFTLIKRVHDDRNEKMEEVVEQLEIVKERLFEKHKQFEEGQQKIVELDTHIGQLDQQIEGLKQTIKDKNNEIHRLEEELANEKDLSSNTQHQLNCDIIDLQESLEDAKNDIHYLTTFKKGYDDLHDAFQEKPSLEFEDEPAKKKKKPVISTKRANLITNIEAAQKLEDQVLNVLNTTVDEYDKFIETNKAEIEEKTNNMDDVSETEFDLKELALDQADQELEAVQERFKITSADLLTELDLLRTHKTMLLEQLQILEENKPSIKKKDLRKFSEYSEQETVAKEDSVLSVGLSGGTDAEDAMLDPFIPQERVFSKYAAMLYTSSEGKTFHEFKDAMYCASCGEKTVICPHKVGKSDKLFVLPPNTTHLKVVRPKVRINREFVDDIMKPPSLDMTYDPPGSVTDQSVISRGQSTMSVTQKDAIQTPQTFATGDSQSIVGAGEAHMVHSMQQLFDDFKNRTSMDRCKPRYISLDRVKSSMEQFYAFILWQDQNSVEEDGYFSILDNLYRYMKKKYLVEDVMLMCTHDFLSSIIEYSGSSKSIQLLGHVLVGNLDAVCLRYGLLMCDFIDVVQWKEVADFRAFASVIYPFLTEDDIETLQMSYTSFSENKISKTIVAKFMVHLILKYREPRFLEIENRLLAYQSGDTGVLTEKEFKEGVENISPLANEKLLRRLYFEAKHGVIVTGQDEVPIMRLAQIASYLVLLQIAHVVKETVNERIIEWRDRPISGGSNKLTHESQLVMAEESLITMTSVKALAANEKKKEQRRLSRYQFQEDEFM